MPTETTTAKAAPSTTTTAKTTSRKRSYKRLSPEEWRTVSQLYGTGSVTLPELSAQFGVSVRSLQNHLAESGTLKGSAAHEATKAATAHALATASPPPAMLTERIRAAKEATYSNALTLQTMLMAQLLPLQEGTIALPPGAAVRVIEQAANALDRVRRVQWAALGIDKEDPTAIEDLPELPIRELTPEEVEEIRAQQQADDRQLGISPEEAEELEDNEVIEEVFDDQEAKS